MKILIASDSYKGSLSSLEVAAAMREGIYWACPEAEVESIVIADGGEGTVNAVIAGVGGEVISRSVCGPLGEPTEAFYGILPSGEAVIEMAAASGLTLVPVGERDVMRATTFGTGELIRAALDEGCRKLYVGVGGSATNDGGAGMAQALGVRFLDEAGNEIGPGGGGLAKLSRIDITSRDPRITGAEIIVMSDVKNPLCGSQGASAIYGPQKGASPEQVEQLDRNLAHLAAVIERDLGILVCDREGAGAAGGLGAGLIAFAGAEICSGIDAILEMNDFRRRAQEADLILTGEGRVDAQSVCGKVVSGVASAAGDTPVAIVAGSLGDGAASVYELGVCAMEATVTDEVPAEEAMEPEGAKRRVADTTEKVLRALILSGLLS